MSGGVHNAKLGVPAPSGLGDCGRLTQSCYRAAVSETVRSLQGVASDQDMADAWGTSAATVGNARNRNNDLSAMPLLKLGERFGAASLDTVLALIGAKAVAREAIMIDAASIAAIPCDVAATVPTLIRLLADGDASDDDVRQLDREGAIDTFVRLAALLQGRRDSLRIRSVS